MPRKTVTLYAGPFEQFDATIAKLDLTAPPASALQFSSYLGGSRGDFANDVVVAPSGAVYVTGGTGSTDFLGITSGALTGRDNAFVANIGNTPPGNNVTVNPDPSTQLTYPSVTAGGNTTVANSTVGPALPTSLQLASNTFTNVTSTATINASDSAPITICIKYDLATIGDPTTVHLLHFQTGQWVDITVSNDRTNGIVCGHVTTLSPFAVVKGKITQVQIEIKPPASPPVPIKVGSSGAIPVAILSSSTFDATKVNPSSISLDGAKVKLVGKGGFSCVAQDVNGDKKNDLVCQVPTNQFQLEPGSDIAVLTATGGDGTPIQGQEAVQVVPQ